MKKYKLTELLRVRLYPHQAKKLAEVAALYGMTTSETIRTLIEQAQTGEDDEVQGSRGDLRRSN